VSIKEVDVRLYRIEFKHYGPKSSKRGTAGFFVAETEDQVADLALCKLGYWDEDDLSEELDVWEEDKIGDATVSKRESLIANRGQIEWEYNEYSDAHYGITHWGWQDVGEATPARVTVLRELGMLLGGDGRAACTLED